MGYCANRCAVALTALLAVGLATPLVVASASTSKAIWGPAQVDGVSQFPIYADLGAGIYMTSLRWNEAAPAQPADPADPADPVYRWPEDLDVVVAEAARYGMEVAVHVMDTPSWANGGRSPRWAPRSPAAFGDFLAAAAARYPGIRHWLIWGEPTKKDNFLPPTGVRPGYQKRAARHYARMLAAAYSALKRANPRNLVIGGNTYTVGDIRAAEFIRAMRLPNGKPPPMDLYGHNPFTLRRPNLAKSPIGGGVLDFSDLDTVARLVDRNLGRTRTGRRLKLFLAEFTLPTDHPNWEFNFWVTRRVQASWLADALRITRRWSRIYTLAWLSLYDDPPRPRGDEVNRGLIDRQGRKKPAYFAFRRG